MKCVFLSSFLKDLQKLSDKATCAQVQELIGTVEGANSPAQIPNLKKMHGRASYYRVRIGNYRVGVIIESNRVTFVRCLNRADIYKHFP